MKPKIFLLIPVYNVELYVRECIDSILNQEFSNYEIIIVDDGSQDNSGKICDEYKSLYSNISVLHKDNGGLISARTAAIDFIKNHRSCYGSYCIFVDSDDKLKPHSLEIIANKIETTQCDMLIYGFEKFMDDKCICIIGDNCKETHINGTHELIRVLLSNSTYNSLCRKAIRTDLLFYNDDLRSVAHIQMGEDLVQTILVAMKCQFAVLIPEALYCYRENTTSITKQKNIKKYTDDLESKEFVVNEIRKHGFLSKEELDEYRQRCLKSLELQLKYILFKNSRGISRMYLETIYNHRFYRTYLQEGITEKSSLFMRLFYKKRFAILIIIYSIKKLCDRLKRNI